MRHYLVCFGLVAVLASCQRDRPQLDERAAPTVVEPSPPPAVRAPPAVDGISGRVVETMDAAGYTYARLDRGGTQLWIAGPQTTLAVGTELGRMEGSLMPNFRSETLKRTFDEIYFVNAFAIAGGAPATASPPPAAAPAPAAGGDDISGTVVETMNAGGYTYALLDRGGPRIWIAGPETKLAVGTKLGRMTGSLMTGFHSDTLKRTFDAIYFVSAIGTGTPAPPNPHGAPAPDVAVEKIAPAPGGKTVAEIFATKAALAGKPVVVRGKIVKLSSGIMGKNWIHLRDGTGGAGTNDLMVTTQANPTVGEVVVVRGTVTVDKNLGPGYRYEVLLEDATVQAK